MNMPPDHEALFARICDGVANDAEAADFQQLLRTDAAALDAWLRYSTLHAELAAGAAFPATADSTPVPAKPAPDFPTRRVGRFPWLPQAAAGLVVGLCAASLVWAYVAPPALRTHALLEEDFEDPELSLAVRSALETGIWRGDSSEITEAQDGMTPATGRKMMRFLRADHDGRLKPTGGHIATIYRLIDLRPLRGEFADGAGVVEVSASFNATEFPAGERYGCAISLYALDADSVPDRAGRLGSTLSDEALAMARSSRTQFDRDPASWQRVTTEIRLPVDAQFLVVRLHVSQPFESGDAPVFTGAYADDIRVSLLSRSAAPSRTHPLPP